jgi:hypothetical protein
MDAIKEIVVGETVVKIYQDDMAESPREWDNLGTMVCFHRRYNLGDKHTMTVEEAKAFVNRKDVISLPLYLYDHSGITMNTTGFSCPWDSGQVGFIYVTREKVRKEYGKKAISPKLLARVLGYLKAEVEVYDSYLTGDVYGFKTFDKAGNELDNSCWGFFGHDFKENGLLEAAA